MMRSTDHGQKHYFRAERMFLCNEHIYFSTRERVDQGPYATPDAAEKALGRYVRTQHKMQRLRERSGNAGDDLFDRESVASISKDIGSWRHAGTQADD